MHRITTRDRVSAPRDQVISWLADQYPAIDWSAVADHLPPIIWRHRWNDYADRYGLPLRRGTIQNRDSAGTGPFSRTEKK
ncbi:MAG: hypothetical protein EA399_07785 [Desulfovibrionales bacterium]|nr:MAG: hypothetical protein EA399_07785 [Desulfovibrionales bacterium]